MKIFVCGSWNKKSGEKYIQEAYVLGVLLAQNQVDLIIGPGTGTAKNVIKGYHSVSPRGKVIFYLPQLKEMKRVGEEMEEGADEVIWTELDYPHRNLMQVKKADAVIALGGQAGSLTEVIAAVLDYHKPTAIYDDDSSELVQASKLLTQLQPYVFYSKDLKELVSSILSRIAS